VIRYQIQVRGEWAGRVGGWRPAVDGTINQTGLPAAEASTFASHDDAQACLDNVLLPELPGEGLDVDVRRNAPEFRIVETSAVVRRCGRTGHVIQPGDRFRTFYRGPGECYELVQEYEAQAYAAAVAIGRAHLVPPIEIMGDDGVPRFEPQA
jgi:hypothetical protein